MASIISYLLAGLARLTRSPPQGFPWGVGRPDVRNGRSQQQGAGPLLPPAQLLPPLMRPTVHPSEQVVEVAQNPWCEVAWYMTDSREQFRICGECRLCCSAASRSLLLIRFAGKPGKCWRRRETLALCVDAGPLRIIGPDTIDNDMQEARALAWRNMSDGGRSQFAWPDPGMARLEDDKAFDVDKALIGESVRERPRAFLQRGIKEQRAWWVHGGVRRPDRMRGIASRSRRRCQRSASSSFELWRCGDALAAMTAHDCSLLRAVKSSGASFAAD